MSGCNDEGSLGRHIEDEEEETFVPGLVILPSKVKQISAGDSHTVVLTEEGQVYYWGTFRDSSGSFGLTPNGQIRNLPVHLGKKSYPLYSKSTLKSSGAAVRHLSYLLYYNV